MKRKITALCLALSLSLTLCACGGSGGEASSQKNAPASTPPEASSQPEPTVQEPSCTVAASQAYSDGMAWVVYRDESGATYTGAMDKEGKVRFCIEGGDVETTPFKDGQAYIETEDGLLLVDQDGLVYDFAGHLVDGELQAYGGGYAVVKRTTSDILEGDINTYVLVDSTGAERTLDREINAGYSSGGIFSDALRGSVDYYFPRADLWLTDALASVESVIYEIFDFDGYVVEIGVTPDWSAASLIYMGKDDTQATVVDMSGVPGLSNMEFVEPEPGYMGFGGGMFSFYAFSAGLDGQEYSNYYFLDLSTGTVHTYEGQYAELLTGACFSTGGDTLALELNGNDGVTYLLMVDRALNELSEPIPVGGRNADYVADSYGIVTEAGILDLEGGQISDGSFTDLEAAVNAADGSSPLVGDGTIKTGEGTYCDYTGNPLFEVIDASGAARIG